MEYLQKNLEDIKMKLNIDFNELLHAFEHARVDEHYFIDTEKNELIYINEKAEDNAKERLEKIKGDRYVQIPPRLPRHDLDAMGLFSYEAGDFNTVDTLLKNIKGKKTA